MVAHRVRLGGGETLALDGADMQELGALEVFHVLQGFHQLGQVVPVQRPDVVKSQFLEHGAGCHHAFHMLLGALGPLPEEAEVLEQALGALPHAQVGLGGPDLGEIGGQAALVVADGHLVVIQDHQHIGPLVPGVGQGFEGHAAGDGPVADHRDDLALQALLPGCQGHAHGGGDAGGRVADPEGVVFALAALGKAGQTASLAHAMHLAHATGEYLVGVGLVAHVPDDAVVGRAEHVVQGHGELYHPQTSAEVAAGLPHAVEQEGPQFVCQLQ